MTWAAGSLCGLDTETGGIDVDNDRIVTASVISYIPTGRAVSDYGWLIAVDVDIDPAATAVHGITAEHAREHGKPAIEALSEISAALTKHWSSDIPLVAYNACFDLSILDAEMRRWLGRPLDIRGPIIDPLVIDRYCDRYRRGSRKLVDTCAHYGITLTEAHSASADTLAAMRLAWKLARIYPEIGGMSLDELQVKQRQWYRESQLSFAGYLRDKIAPSVPVGERAGILLRADQVEASADGWPMRISAEGDIR